MGSVDCNIAFVVGVGRSGTSLLQGMLNSHPAICFAPETQFVRKYLATRKLERLFNVGGLQAVAQCLKSDTSLGRLGLSGEELMEAIVSCGDPFHACNLYLALLARYVASRADAVWLGDKDPRCVEYLPVVYRHFAGARIIHLVRDPRDVLASKRKAAWSSHRSVPSLVFANRVQLRIGRRQGERLFGDRYLEVAYEELVGNAEGALTRICRFLALDYDPAMLDFAASSHELVSEDEMQWKKETLGPLMVANVGKWQESLAPREVALCERACREAFESYGYRRSDCAERLGIKASLWVAVWSVVLASMDPPYRFYRNWCVRP